jgi:hypothetical protein
METMWECELMWGMWGMWVELKSGAKVGFQSKFRGRVFKKLCQSKSFELVGLQNSFFVAIKNITSQWSMSTMAWNSIYLQLEIHFNNRITEFKRFD